MSESDNTEPVVTQEASVVERWEVYPVPGEPWLHNIQLRVKGVVKRRIENYSGNVVTAADHDRIVADLQRKLQQREAEVGIGGSPPPYMSWMQQVAERDAQIAKLMAVGSEKDATIAELRAELLNRDDAITNLRAEVERFKQPQYSEVFMHDEARWISTSRAIVERLMIEFGADNTDFRERDRLIGIASPYLDKQQHAMYALRTRAEAAEAEVARQHKTIEGYAVRAAEIGDTNTSEELIAAFSAGTQKELKTHIEQKIADLAAQLAAANRRVAAVEEQAAKFTNSDMVAELHEAYAFEIAELRASQCTHPTAFACLNEAVEKLRTRAEAAEAEVAEICDLFLVDKRDPIAGLRKYVELDRKELDALRSQLAVANERAAALTKERDVLRELLARAECCLRLTDYRSSMASEIRAALALSQPGKGGE